MENASEKLSTKSQAQSGKGVMIVYDFISKLPLQAKASFNIHTKVHRGEIKKKRLDLY